MKLNNMGLGVTLIAFLVGGVLGLAAPFRLHASASNTARQPESLPTYVAAPQAPDYRRIAAANGPAVVGIFASASTDAKTQLDGAPDLGADTTKFSPNDPFFRFFRDLPIPHANLRADLVGSGFIVSSDGVVLTNAHLVRDASAVAVMLADRRKLQARVIGIDPMLDVAVLKIDVHHLPTVHLGNSGALAIGDSVLALGDPYDLEENAVAGIVSAIGRSGSLVPFIQTDIALHFGNSGGPLLDSEGRVIGINAQIYTSPEGYQGISYAIPINVAMSVESEVARLDRRSQLGIQVESPTPFPVSLLQCPYTNGDLVPCVASRGTAATAGPRPGDTVLRYGHIPIIDVKHQRFTTKVPGPVMTTAAVLRNDRVLMARVDCCQPVVPPTAASHGELPAYPRPRIGFPSRSVPSNIAFDRAYD